MYAKIRLKYYFTLKATLFNEDNILNTKRLKQDHNASFYFIMKNYIKKGGIKNLPPS